jgi:hypothetical protein
LKILLLLWVLGTVLFTAVAAFVVHRLVGGILVPVRLEGVSGLPKLANSRAGGSFEIVLSVFFLSAAKG